MSKRSRKIGALWLRTSKDGNTRYYSGVIETLHGDVQIAVFQNDRKEKDNHPDFNIVLSGDRQQQKKKKNDNAFIGDSSAPKPQVKVDKKDIPVIEEDDPNDPESVEKAQEVLRDDEIDVSQIPF